MVSNETRFHRQEWLLLGGLALVKTLVQLWSAWPGAYGSFRDEFYYLDCAQHLGDRLGWEEFVAVLAGACDRLDAADRARCGIFVSNYGEAGAVNLFGPRYGLPNAISGYMNNYLWGPGEATGHVMLFYWDDRETLDELFQNVTEVARFTHPYVMARQNDRPLYLCRTMRVPMRDAWSRFKAFK